MKPKFVLLCLCVFTAAALAGVLAVHQRQAAGRSQLKTFAVRGVVREVDVLNKTVRIVHEAIPDYMEAMTMPFSVRDPSALKGVAAGDCVQFQLAVTDDDSWIARIEKIASGPDTVAAIARTPIDSSADRESERVQAGEKVPDFKLVDQDGRPIHLSDFRGKAVLLTFIYTRCPLPNYCPLMSKNFVELQKRLSKEFPGQYQLLSISMDSEFDTPAVLKEYAARYEANPKDWSFATGDAEQIDNVARLMGLYYVRENGLISHDLRTALIAPDGRLVHLWKSNVWTPYEVQRMVRQTLSETKGFANGYQGRFAALR